VAACDETNEYWHPHSSVSSTVNIMAMLSSLLRTLISWTWLGVVALGFVPLMLLLLPSRRLRICAFNVFGRLTGRVMIFFMGATLPSGIRAQLRSAHPAIY